MREAEYLNLWLFPPSLHGEARAAFEAGDVVGFLRRANTADCLEIVAANVLPLKARGIYERALLLAYWVTSTRFPLGGRPSNRWRRAYRGLGA